MSLLWTDMAVWWLRLAVAGGLLLLAGAVLVLACRRPAIRLRTASWVFAVAMLLVPLTLLPGWLQLPWSLPTPQAASGSTAMAEKQSVLPAYEMPIRSESHVPAVEPEVVGFFAEDIAPPAPAAAVPVEASNNPVVKRQPAPAGNRSILGWIANILLVCYWTVVLTLLGRLAIGQWRLENLWRSATQAPQTVRQALAQLGRGSQCQPTVRVSECISGPICFGVFRPRILIPTVLAEQSSAQMLHWILAHELSHLRRRDPLVGWLMGLVHAVFFFEPWLWKLRREVRLNQEFLADAAAANQTIASGSAADYADFLVQLTCAGKIPIGAAGVKSRASDLFRRVTMLLQTSGTIETKCPRRWSLLAGGTLLALGIGLAGLTVSTRNAAADPVPVGDPAKKGTTNDDDEIRKALESLKKGPEAKKEVKPEVKPEPSEDLNPVDKARRAEEALKKAQEELRKNPASEEARKAYEEALKKMKDTPRNRQPDFPQPFPQFPNFPQLPPLQPINPAGFDKEVERFNEQLQKMMEELHRQMQAQGGAFPGRPPIGGLGGFRNLNRRSGEGRLGVRVERPTPILIEQLDLPADKGAVVTDVVPDSTAAKAGIKINDILLEIGGKVVSGDVIDLQRLLREFKADQKVDIVLLRRGKKETLKDVALPEAKPDVLNPFNPRLLPNIPNNPRFPNGFPPEFFGNGANNTAMSVQVVNGDYTIKCQENGVKVTILGFKADGGLKPTSIEIDDNGKTSKATSLDKVDEAYRPMVEKVLKQIK
jgi:beta-lactamase regulating signal transducer with metallopeptidase domain